MTDDGSMTTRGFTGSPANREAAVRLPAGQYLTQDFPVLSLGATPVVPAADWRLRILDGDTVLASWSWDRFNRLPQTEWRGDIHCVTKWSKFDTVWRGVLFDDLLAATGIETPGGFVVARSYDGYDTNLPVADLAGGRAMIATHFAGQKLAGEHGGPARLLVPHLYFWKSAKWVSELVFTPVDRPGFWEQRGYHMYGDPWLEQRYTEGE